MEKIKELYNVIERTRKTRLQIFSKFSLSDTKYEKYCKLNQNQRRVFKLLGSKKRKNLYRLQITLDYNLFKDRLTKKEFEEVINYFSKIIPSIVEANIFVNFHLDAEKYTTIPPLPTGLEKGNAKFGAPLLTGVKINFQDPKTDLEAISLDVAPCVDCGKIESRVSLFIKKKLRITEKDIVEVYKTAKDYSGYFYEPKSKTRKA